MHYVFTTQACLKWTCFIKEYVILSLYTNKQAWPYTAGGTVSLPNTSGAYHFKAGLVPNTMQNT